MENRAMPRAGEFYMHFKGKLYQIVTVAIHTETEEPLVVYQAMYGTFKTLSLIHIYLKTRENDTAYERKSDESSIINTIRIQKRMKSKKRLWRNSELLLLQYPLAQDIIHK